MTKLNKKNILIGIFILIIVISFVGTLKKGKAQVDENGYIDSSLMDMQYKYKEEWEKVPQEFSSTLYIKDENGENKTIITMYAFPLNLLNATEENAYDVIRQTYTGAYTILDTNEIEIDGKRSVVLDYYSQTENFGGKIYILVNNNVGYTIMCTEKMTEPTIIDNEIIEEFLKYVHF